MALCNADLNGVLFISEAAKILFAELRLQGVDLTAFHDTINLAHIPQQEIVNLAYKDLIFTAFESDLPEAIVTKGPPDPLAKFNLATNGKILSVSDQSFARAENLLSGFLPVFDPGLYGRQGKIMDSWETKRHNYKTRDELIFKLEKASVVRFVSLSTKFHLGNQAQAVSLEGRSDNGAWQPIAEKLNLQGHAIQYLKSANTSSVFTEIKSQLYPDGGLTRLGLFAELPQPFESLESHVFAEAIPQSRRPLSAGYQPTAEEVQRNWQRLPVGDEVDVACSAFGGKVVRASDEHYGSAAHVISPFPPLDMFDGFESARSRVLRHSEEVEIELGRICRVHRIEVDFTYFKNNNPRELRIEGLSGKGWIELVPKTGVKAYAGNTIAFPVLTTREPLRGLRLTVYPDGGLNRVRAISNHTL